MKPIYFLLFSFLICTMSAFAQSGNSDRCEVAIGDIKVTKSTDLDKFTTAIGGEVSTTHAFRVPHSTLFIVSPRFLHGRVDGVRKQSGIRVT